MAYNFYLAEKLAEAHRQDLLREAEQQRLVASLPGPRSRRLRQRVAQVGLFLLALGTRLKQFALSKKTVARA
jgi:hypothetical protein